MLFPRSFTAGESNIIASLIFILFLRSSFIFSGKDRIDALSVLLIACPFLLYPFVLYVFKSQIRLADLNSTNISNSNALFTDIFDAKSWKKKSLSFIAILLIFIFLFFYPIAFKVLNDEPISWLVEFLFNNSRMLFVLYFIAVLFPIIIIHPTEKSTNVANILVRKYYHFLAVIMFLPAIYFDSPFFKVASSGAWFIMTLAELIRIVNVTPISDLIHAYTKEYVDSRDSGILIVTHIYLLVGCSLPIWLEVNSNIISENLSGVAILGIGDAIASWIGKFYGNHKWPKSHKSLEGTFAAIVSVFLFLYPFCNNFIGLMCATILTCLVEAFTEQIDNLILPLFFYSALKLFNSTI